MATTRQLRSPLHRAGGLAYHLARECDDEGIARLLAARFVHEPMGAALGLTEAELYEFVRRFLPGRTSTGFSIVAIAEGPADVLAGAFINRDFKAPVPVGVPEEFPRWSPIFAAVGKVDEAYEAQVPGLEAGQALDLWMVGVDPSYSRRGVARNLFRLSVEVARRQGFERCVAECTGAFSQRAAVEAGFRERASVTYKDFLFEGRPVFASIPEPHVKVALYERVLFPR